ncbi:IQ calmodulin-binding motif protein [Aspergillus melleus]|uniref:IQ calmodulin-binding motif protein n=1 Tax=Aspergillus melleus TaxID=138277 RepID=UPI001E8EF142|nr:uncharacterized protein LDX57_010324 [Aspergillus melleus]KAH8432697.1 hypothetical protein LDX57_010324 [Aspergillus melleus]
MASTDANIPTARSQVPLDDVTAQNAARIIQRAYRGYRTRRELCGLGLDASTRWVEAVKDAEWHLLHRPTAPSSETNNTPKSQAKLNWKRAVSVAKQAGGDDNTGLGPTPTSPADDSPRSSCQSQPASPTATRPHDLPPGTSAKTMDLQYFLEMVDLKHRHGSNLRKYHTYWMNSPSKQNFFYWLDHGEGKELELPKCSRERLNREQVRYLTREERMNYLVRVDVAGRFRWAKNEELVCTDSTRFKDSLRGVVPVEEDAPPFKGNFTNASYSSSSLSSSAEGAGLVDSDSDSAESSLSSSSDEIEKLEKDDYQSAKFVKRLVHATPGGVLKQLRGKSVKRGDMWIFVADTSWRVYIGIKESGAFQHSSFLRGARIAAAGLIKIKEGQLRSLAPLSGHYRPPAANFRAFVHALQDQGVDMSHVSISKSYAVLAGIEGYGKAKRTVRALHEKVDNSKHKIQHSLHAAGTDHDSAHGKASTHGRSEKVLPFRTKSPEVHATKDDQAS